MVRIIPLERYFAIRHVKSCSIFYIRFVTFPEILEMAIVKIRELKETIENMTCRWIGSRIFQISKPILKN